MAKKQHAGKAGASHQGAGRSRGHKTRAGTRMSLLPWIALAVIVVAAAAFILLQPRQAVATEITVAQAYEKYQAGAFFLDVRTEAEYAEGHVPNSVLIPLDELKQRLDELPRDQEVVVICRSGNRSKEAAAMLLEAGFERAPSVSGGLKEWSAAGYPVEQ